MSTIITTTGKPSGDVATGQLYLGGRGDAPARLVQKNSGARVAEMAQQLSKMIKHHQSVLREQAKRRTYTSV